MRKIKVLLAYIYLIFVLGKNIVPARNSFSILIEKSDFTKFIYFNKNQKNKIENSS